MKKAILASCSGAMTERWFLYMKILRVSSEISMMLLPCNNIESTEPVLFHSVCVGASGGLVPAGSYPAASLTVRFLAQGCSRFVPEPYWIYMNKYEYNNSNIYIFTIICWLYDIIWLWSYWWCVHAPGFNAAAWQMVPATAALCRSRTWWNCETLEKRQMLEKRL